jgi:hypothetical protein
LDLRSLMLETISARRKDDYGPRLEKLSICNDTSTYVLRIKNLQLMG